jgi:hypothetical protein
VAISRIQRLAQVRKQRKLNELPPVLPKIQEGIPKMKSLRLPFFCAAILFLTSTGIADARFVQVWTPEELFNRSDLVVIATPTSVADTGEHGSFPGSQFRDQPVFGVVTTFAVKKVLKGAKGIAIAILHHYRPGPMQVPNAPGFISFDPKSKQSYRLFLIRERHGRYAPAAGQVDPDLSVFLVK